MLRATNTTDVEAVTIFINNFAFSFLFSGEMLAAASKQHKEVDSAHILCSITDVVFGVHKLVKLRVFIVVVCEHNL